MEEFTIEETVELPEHWESLSDTRIKQTCQKPKELFIVEPCDGEGQYILMKSSWLRDAEVVDTFDEMGEAKFEMVSEAHDIPASLGRGR